MQVQRLTKVASATIAQLGVDSGAQYGVVDGASDGAKSAAARREVTELGGEASQPKIKMTATTPHSTRGSDGAVPNNDTDQALVRRVQKGDRRAFDLLFSRYQHKILSLVRRYVSDDKEAEDVTQEAFIKAYRALPRFRGDSQFYTWLYRIAINTSKNYLVSRSRRPPTSDVDHEEADFLDGSEPLKELESPDRALSTGQLALEIRAALSDLPEDLRSAVTLREFDGMSYEQIADVMECPVGTVRSRIFRAREAIETRIRPLLEATQ